MLKGYMKAMGYFIVTVVIATALGCVLKPLIFASDAIAVKNSIQYQETQDVAVKQLEAQLEVVEGKLMRHPDDEDLQAQADALRVQLSMHKQ